MRSLVAILVLIAFVGVSYSVTPSEESTSETITKPITEKPNSEKAVQLLDVADAGAVHAKEANRNARLIGFGGYGGYYRPWGYRPWGYRPWGYRPWGYRPWGYGYGYRPWGGYYRPHYHFWG